MIRGVSRAHGYVLVGYAGKAGDVQGWLNFPAETVQGLVSGEIRASKKLWMRDLELSVHQEGGKWTMRTHIPSIMSLYFPLKDDPRHQLAEGLVAEA